MLAGLGAAAATPSFSADRVLYKKIGASGDAIPAVGMGSWRTFDVGLDGPLSLSRRAVLKTFLEQGGALIDSSPMYGSSQAVIGASLAALDRPTIFSADKVWVEGREAGRRQIGQSLTDWRLRKFDLLQVHNLVDWRTHLPTLFEMKAAGAVRYVGVTSYAGLRYDDMARIVATEPLDFIQLTYNIADREAEERLLPLAQDKGVAVIANRPFREGALTERLRGVPLPAVAAEIGAATWAQFLLKFVISHPGITAAIPATRRIDHMAENMGAMRGLTPDAATRLDMVRAFDLL